MHIDFCSLYTFLSVEICALIIVEVWRDVLPMQLALQPARVNWYTTHDLIFKTEKTVYFECVWMECLKTNQRVSNDPQQNNLHYTKLQYIGKHSIGFSTLKKTFFSFRVSIPKAFKSYLLCTKLPAPHTCFYLLTSLRSERKNWT